MTASSTEKSRLWLWGGLAALILIVVAGLLFSRWGGDKANEPVLRVGNQKGTTRALMEASGVLDGIPYKIEWSEFPAAQHLLEALAANAVDIGFVGDAPFLFAYAGGSPLKVVAVASQGTNGSSTAILVPANSPIHSVADLKDKKVATGKISIGNYLVLRALEKDGLKTSDITSVYLAPSDARTAFSSGAIDAWATWSPFLDAAILQDKARVLIDGSGLLAGYGYHVATPEAIAGKQAQLRDFADRLSKAYEWAKTHNDEYAAAFSKATGLPIEIATSYVKNSNPVAVPLNADTIKEAYEVFRVVAGAEGITVDKDRPVKDAFAKEFIVP